jgi:hypothetical protein
VILLISASQVARITGMWHSIWFFSHDKFCIPFSTTALRYGKSVHGKVNFMEEIKFQLKKTVQIRIVWLWSNVCCPNFWGLSYREGFLVGRTGWMFT